MERLEQITLSKLAFEVCFGSLGYQVQLKEPVVAECFMPTTPSNKPLQVTLPFGAVLAGKGVELRVPDGYDATEVVDMEYVTQLVREHRADREEDRIEQLAARRGVSLPSFA